MRLLGLCVFQPEQQRSELIQQFSEYTGTWKQVNSCHQQVGLKIQPCRDIDWFIIDTGKNCDRTPLLLNIIVLLIQMLFSLLSVKGLKHITRYRSCVFFLYSVSLQCQDCCQRQAPEWKHNYQSPLSPQSNWSSSSALSAHHWCSFVITSHRHYFSGRLLNIWRCSKCFKLHPVKKKKGEMLDSDLIYLRYSQNLVASVTFLLVIKLKQLSSPQFKPEMFSYLDHWYTCFNVAVRTIEPILFLSLKQS